MDGIDGKEIKLDQAEESWTKAKGYCLIQLSCLFTKFPSREGWRGATGCVALKMYWLRSAFLL
jgi:hypothetical protein